MQIEIMPFIRLTKDGKPCAVATVSIVKVEAVQRDGGGALITLTSSSVPFLVDEDSATVVDMLTWTPTPMIAATDMRKGTAVVFDTAGRVKPAIPY